MGPPPPLPMSPPPAPLRLHPSARRPSRRLWAPVTGPPSPPLRRLMARDRVAFWSTFSAPNPRPPAPSESLAAESPLRHSRTGARHCLLGGGGQHVILETFAQCSLLNLSRRGVRNFVDERHVVGHPPLGDLAVQIAEQFGFVGRLAFLEHDDKQ